ncbi:hypothetical protein J14TS5_40270 [Paenibacillus lautus]|nr:hypothetical protein J14TS5_40270 [Paenibacillus lautus]
MQPLGGNSWECKESPVHVWSHELGFWVWEGEKGKGCTLCYGPWGGAYIGSGRC